LLADLELHRELEPKGHGFFDDEEPASGEDLNWLVKAKQGQHLWLLLNTAVKLGQSLNQYNRLRESNVEKAIRQMLTVRHGKRPGVPGKAIEHIISAAKEAGLSLITPKKLLNWLKGKQPYDIGEALIVSHPLWVNELKDLTWEKFQNLVRAAGRRSRPD